ncbi:MAG: hypothetical protein HQL99_13050 [Magnetococcales bacterium]|nr:hypothetical protein [Magnetococcales bacterium]
MAQQALKKQRSQARAARKRADRGKTGQRRPAVMSAETFHRLAGTTAEAVAKDMNLPTDDVMEAMEWMAEEGYLGLNARGRLGMRKDIKKDPGKILECEGSKHGDAQKEISG